MYMRHHIEHCLRNLISVPAFQGKFSEEMGKFWHDVEVNYKHCGIPSGVPQNHIPMWWERAKELKIPIEFVVVEPVQEPVKEPVPVKLPSLVKSVPPLPPEAPAKKRGRPKKVLEPVGA